MFCCKEKLNLFSGVGGVAAGPATAGGAEAAAEAGAGVERGEGGAGATLETKGWFFNF